MIENDVKHGALDKPDALEYDLFHSDDVQAEVVFRGKNSWQANRPNTLVVACSDGRLQESIDEFLGSKLGVVDYDRLYAPGGPGALGIGTPDVRTDQVRRELAFLMTAHKIAEVVLIFHGADRTGPDDAVCAHYKRVLPGASRRQIAAAQREDAAEAMRMITQVAPNVKVRVFRAEVNAACSVHFVDLRRR